MRSRTSLVIFLTFLVLFGLNVHAQQPAERTLHGVIVTGRKEVVPDVNLVFLWEGGELRLKSDIAGRFSATVPVQTVRLNVAGKNLRTLEKTIPAGSDSEELRIEVAYIIPPVHDSTVIEGSTLEPAIDRRNDAVYRETLFSRDDQIFHTLDAGINAGQHEGGGKSVEVRRFGFNLDHGGVNGGLKVLVDDVQQNQGSQGHGQGYLGALKSLTPELIADVNILNGPFNAEYGDFSGLGVVHIRLKESLADQLTLRLQGGSFGSYRTFVGYSPKLRNGTSFIAYESAHTDGPFKSPLRYQRDNFTGNYTWQIDRKTSLGLKLNYGRNNFFSSGQIPLDQVENGALDRFGFVDPDDGGRVRLGTGGIYYRREWDSGDNLKIDGFISRSLFDLYSNFTFYLTDTKNGDGIQQHDSRLQEGINVQFIHPYSIWGKQALLTAGSNFHDNQIYVALFPRTGRRPISDDPSAANLTTKSQVHVTNLAGYLQQAIEFLNGRVHVDGGLRFDYFRFDVRDRLGLETYSAQPSTRLQPKANIAYSPAKSLPLTFYFNYGRGISSQDARGVVQRPESPRLATTDFSQIGASIVLKRVSISSDLFLIDRSNEQVYIPDDGTFEFKGPSRSNGFEVKTSIQLTRVLSFNGGITQVMNSFYRRTKPRVYVDSAPHTVANAAFTLSTQSGWTSSVRYRHTGNYRLDGEDVTIRASGLDVIDISVNKKLRPWIELNLSFDNVTNKKYYETQNYFDSRLTPTAPVITRIHATPGYPFSVTGGMTFRLFNKQ